MSDLATLTTSHILVLVLVLEVPGTVIRLQAFAARPKHPCCTMVFRGPVAVTEGQRSPRGSVPSIRTS